MNKIGVRWRLLIAAVALIGASCPANAQISNGGFENNGGAGFSSFTDWTTADESGSAGSFFVQTGTGTPLFGNLVPAPPEGAFAAMTEGGGAGSHVLYQDFVAPFNVGSATLSFQAFVNNLGNDFFTPNTLDAFSGAANQQARVDLVLAGSDPFSVAGSDVLLTLFQTLPGDPLISGYTLVSTDITGVLQSHGGELLRLRFAEVDNVAPLNFGVDDVRLLAVVPEPSALALLVAGGVSGSLLLRRRRRNY